MDRLYHLGSWSCHQPSGDTFFQVVDHKTSEASAYTQVWSGLTPDWSIKPIISGSNLPESDDSSRETDPVLCSDGELWCPAHHLHHYHYLPLSPLTTTYTNINTTLENRPREQHISVHSLWYVVQSRLGQRRSEIYHFSRWNWKLVQALKGVLSDQPLQRVLVKVAVFVRQN